MKEVADLDAQLRQAVEERDAAVSALKTMQEERQGAEATNELSERLVRTMEAQSAAVRTEREELARQHAEDREFLNGIFTELEAQLQLARTEREEANARAERERRTSSKRIRELEEALSAAHASKDRMREANEREKEVLAKQFEQRVAGLRLEKEQAKLDKSLLRRLEKELSEIRTLSEAFLGSGGGELGPPAHTPMSAERSRTTSFH